MAAPKLFNFPPHVRLLRERSKYPKLDTRPVIRDPFSAARLFREMMQDEEQEIFAALWLDIRSRVVSHTILHRGVSDSCLVGPKELFRHALAEGASGIIVAHNHPSGDPTPSEDDKRTTRNLVAAGMMLDLPVYDHIIIGEEGRWLSFSQAGLM
jgi:DNA repair protein RadC